MAPGSISTFRCRSRTKVRPTVTGSSQMSVLILVIDDDVRVRVTIQRLLEAANFHIITAPSGQAGLTLFRAHEPALVITDIIMPEREVLRRSSRCAGNDQPRRSLRSPAAVVS
jgi:CheY-like chemotaxis protein